MNKPTTNDGFSSEELELIAHEEEIKQKRIRQQKLKEVDTLIAEETGGTPNTISEIAIDRLEEKELEKIAPSTGFPKLDALIKGFVPGHLYTLTGQTNIGKTSLACNFAYHVASQGKKVLYLALEPDNTVVDYLASVANKKRFDQIVEADYKFPYSENIEVFKKDKICTPKKLVDVITTHNRYDLVVVDHVGYFITDTNNPYQLQSDVIKILAGLAKAKRCAIMIIAHMRKNGPKKKKSPYPSMDDISGSAAFKQDSTDVLIAIRNENEKDEFGLTYTNEGFILVNKTKSGPNGVVEINFIDGGANIVEQKEPAWKPTF